MRNTPITQNPAITRYEREGQSSHINLAEAYPYRMSKPSEARILSSVQAVYNASLGAKAQELEQRFVKDYFHLSGQVVPEAAEPFVFFSASEAISVTARILAKRGMSCAVLEPTLDVIPSILKNAGVRIIAYRESLLTEPESLLQQIDADAIYMALPNNPTGLFLDRPAFTRLVQASKHAGKTLIIDACFRAFEPGACFDQYALLEKAGADYLVIEDTGKLWATNGIKAGVLVASKKYFSDARMFFDDLILNISPFTMMLLWRLASEGGAETIAEIREHVRNNRALIQKILEKSRVFSVSDGSSISIEQIFYDPSVFKNQRKLLLDLRARGLSVVGSESLFWAGYEHAPFLRIALSRNADAIRQGLGILIQAEKDIAKRRSDKLRD